MGEHREVRTIRGWASAANKDETGAIESIIFELWKDAGGDNRALNARVARIGGRKIQIDTDTFELVDE